MGGLSVWRRKQKTQADRNSGNQPFSILLDKFINTWDSEK